MFSERVEISKSQLSTPNKRFLEKVKLFCTIIRPNLANSDAKFGQFWKIKKIKDTYHTCLKCLLESRFWVEKSQRAKRYALGSSFAENTPNKATSLKTKVTKWF